MDKMMMPAVRAAKQVEGLVNELHDLIRKVRRQHPVDPVSCLTPSEIAQIEKRIAELEGRHGYRHWKKPTEGTAAFDAAPMVVPAPAPSDQDEGVYDQSVAET